MCDERLDGARQGALPRQLLRRRRLGRAVPALLRERDRRQRQLRASPARRTATGNVYRRRQLRRRRQRGGRLPLLAPTRGSTGGSITTCQRLPDARRRGALPQRTRARTSSSIRQARSCTKFLAEHLRRRVRLGLSRRTPSWCDWADIIDGAQFESPKAAVELAEPALQLMTWVENNHDPALKLRFIDELTSAAARRDRRRALGDRTRSRPILERHARVIDVIRARAHARARRGHLRRRRRRARRLQQVHPLLPVPRLPLRRRRLARRRRAPRSRWARTRGCRAAHRQHRRRSASATAAAATRWSARSRSGRTSCARAREIAAEIADELRRCVARRLSMPSFDVVSKVDMAEVDNAVNQAKKELGQRYDFRGTNTELEHTDEGHRCCARRRGAPAGRLQGADGEAGQARRLAARARSAGAGARRQADAAPADHAQAGDLDGEGQGDRQADQGRQAQGAGADSGRAGARDRQEPRRPAGGDSPVARRTATTIGLDLQFINFRD